MKLKYDISLDEIRVGKEPQATTKILPFPKNEVLGKHVHVCFDLEGGSGLMKGLVDAYDNASDKFHISFFDGDEITTNFVSDGDTVLWETGDITMDASWPSAAKVEKEQAVKANDVDKKPADEAKVVPQMPVVKIDDTVVKENVAAEAKKKIKSEADGGLGNDKDNQSEEIEIDDNDNDEETESADVCSNKPLDKSIPKIMPTDENAESKLPPVIKPGSGGKKNVTMGRVSQALDKKRSSMHDNNIKNKKPKASISMVTEAEQSETPEEFRKSIIDAGHNLIDSLKKLEQSLQKISKISDRLCEYKESGKANELKASNILQTARGLLTRLLSAKSDKKETGQIEGIWPINDHVMKVIARFYDTTSDLCTEAKLPMQPVGNALLSWKNPSSKVFENDRTKPNSAQKKPDEGKLRLASALHASKTTTKPKPAGKVEHYDPFAGTGNSIRDESLRILAHSMISTATPLEIAVELEKYASSKYGAEKDGNMPEQYLEAVKAMWDYLSPESKNCRPILRLMIRERVLDPKDIISLSGEDLKRKEAEFYTNMQSTEWLRDSLLQD